MTCRPPQAWLKWCSFREQRSVRERSNRHGTGKRESHSRRRPARASNNGRRRQPVAIARPANHSGRHRRHRRSSGNNHSGRHRHAWETGLHGGHGNGHRQLDPKNGISHRSSVGSQSTNSVRRGREEKPQEKPTQEQEEVREESEFREEVQARRCMMVSAAAVQGPRVHRQPL